MGETVDFKITFVSSSPDEEPDQDIVWGGTSGAVGAEQTISVKFDVASTTTSDFKTVTVTSGSTKSVNVLVCRYVLGIHFGTGNGPWSAHQRFYLLDPDQKAKLDTFLTKVQHWTPTYDCADFASELDQATTGEKVSARDYVIFGTPRAISESIDQLEAVASTSLLNPFAVSGKPGNGSFTSFSDKHNKVVPRKK